ncbi:biotin transporter BioY [Alkaliphilus hydrothermalis]|uniref:Biotin transporter n=1 Tax=Alkaliphilus hydrothermalis TaxID=1482730 RepID=A0ABS2NR77_9FIRM|nr:biotin transporter BioY [Alkaliphilus hydrothermalis]MBM7615430.1 biotin transport system substrate-specific component [Alkaliphilus hydrothermalis]
MKLSTRNMTLVALFAAITAVCSQIAIPLPFSPVPFTLQVVAVCLAGGILGSKLGGLALIVYILMGAAGMPVFAQFKGGLQVLVGPTGGFLFSFPIAAFLIGFVMERKNSLVTSIASMMFALILIYGLGFVQFKFVTAMGWEKSFYLVVAPYVVPDIIKIILTSAVVLSVNRSLERNNLKPKLQKI